MRYDAGEYDIAVVGAGHAGIEAALAAARLQVLSPWRHSVNAVSFSLMHLETLFQALGKLPLL